MSFQMLWHCFEQMQSNVKNRATPSVQTMSSTRLPMAAKAQTMCLRNYFLMKIILLKYTKSSE